MEKVISKRDARTISSSLSWYEYDLGIDTFIGPPYISIMLLETPDRSRMDIELTDLSASFTQENSEGVTIIEYPAIGKISYHIKKSNKIKK